MSLSMHFRLGAAVALAAASLSASAAMIVPTGGTLTLTPSDSSPTVVVDDEYGALNYRSQIVVPDWPEPMTVTTAAVSGSVSLYELSLNPRAYSVYDVITGQTTTSRARGTIGFDLTEEATLTFSFRQTIDNWYWNTSTVYPIVTIRDAQGAVVFGCTGGSPAFYNTWGGCAVGSQPQPTLGEPLLPSDGFMQLLAGHYEISFDVRSDVLVGTQMHSDFTLGLGLSVVPLPAALPLLLSGLGLLGGLRRRKSA